MLLGAHMSISKGFDKAVEEAATHLECNAMQIFLKSPRGGKIKPLLDTQIQAYQETYEKHNFQFVVGHSSYLLNLAKDLTPDFDDEWQVRLLLDDFEKLAVLKGKGLVYHVGKHLKLPYEEAEEKLVENLKKLLDRSHKYGVPLLLENCAGQGTEMGLTLESIKSVLDQVQGKEHLKVCLDTCHAFAAGYNLKDPAEVENFFTQIQNTITLENVVCFHLNDSKFDQGARRDRHANLGQGFIQEPGLKKFVQLATFHNIPLVLETPLINNSHLDDINIVKSWVA